MAASRLRWAKKRPPWRKSSSGSCGQTSAGSRVASTNSGHVTEASGTAVPNAKVQAVNVDNNETTTGNSDNSGAYTITFLRPGIYKLTATAAGFKQYVQDKLTLEAAKVSGIDIHLEVGGVNESVEVTADAV